MPNQAKLGLSLTTHHESEMNKGPIAAILLIFGFMLRFGALFLDASDPSEGNSVAVFIACLGVILWMAGSFVLASHLRLDLVWGFAGLLFIIGLYLMFRKASKQSRRYTSISRREVEERKANTYDY